MRRFLHFLRLQLKLLHRPMHNYPSLDDDAFWSGFRDGFTGWMRVFDIPPRPSRPSESVEQNEWRGL